MHSHPSREHLPNFGNTASPLNLTIHQLQERHFKSNHSQSFPEMSYLVFIPKLAYIQVTLIPLFSSESPIAFCACIIQQPPKTCLPSINSLPEFLLFYMHAASDLAQIFGGCILGGTCWGESSGDIRITIREGRKNIYLRMEGNVLAPSGWGRF
ncbi:hypothetical protein CEXT_812881 [Caerostris extrusa]|uniref:Uncharacterized protein n=1 Tax=Caerostris extrusa TaxID=172846 RepID=A0AAV4NCR1_CAEEX|nr:hypothetical protein CEXT_812881 [Caerostris extrusa]